VLTDRVLHDWKRLKRRMALVDETDDEDERARRMHAVRKAAKRARYAAEALVAQHGKPAKRFVKANKRVQSVLGDHQDSVVTQEELRKLGDAAVADGEDPFTFGVLHAREDLNQDVTEERMWDAWAKASKKKLRKWLK
jgi:CHAD domain-containing protein